MNRSLRSVRKRPSLDIAFAAMIAVSALPGLLVIPDPRYVLGLKVVAALYAIVSIEHAVRQAREIDLRSRLWNAPSRARDPVAVEG